MENELEAELLTLAADCGLPAPLVLADRLPEVMAGADMVLTMGLSSVLYDAFLLRKPSIVVMPASVRRHARAVWFTRGIGPFEFGVCEAVTEGGRRPGIVSKPFIRKSGVIVSRRTAGSLRTATAFTIAVWMKSATPSRNGSPSLPDPHRTPSVDRPRRPAYHGGPPFSLRERIP